MTLCCFLKCISQWTRFLHFLCDQWRGAPHRHTATLRTSTSLWPGATVLSACQPWTASSDHPYRSSSPIQVPFCITHSSPPPLSLITPVLNFRATFKEKTCRKVVFYSQIPTSWQSVIFSTTNCLLSHCTHLPNPSRELNPSPSPPPHLLQRVWGCILIACIREVVLRKCILFHFFDFPHKVVYIYVKVK